MTPISTISTPPSTSSPPADQRRPLLLAAVAAGLFIAALDTYVVVTVLPRLESDRKIIEQTTLDLMELPEGAF